MRRLPHGSRVTVIANWVPTPLGRRLDIACPHASHGITFSLGAPLEGPTPDIGVVNYALAWVALVEANHPECHCWRDPALMVLQPGTWMDRFLERLRLEPA